MQSENYRKSDVPLLEFDPDPQAILQPHGPKINGDIPERVLLCFFLDVFKQLLEAGKLVEVGRMASEMGPNPVYRMDHLGHSMLVVHPGSWFSPGSRLHGRDDRYRREKVYRLRRVWRAG